MTVEFLPTQPADLPPLDPIRIRPSRFATLEIGRGVAALLVVLHHAGSTLAEPRFYGYNAFRSHLGNFNVGVDFFFVLSGFIITWAHWKDIGQPARIGTFIRKRFLRIYPPYWGVLIPLTLLYLAVPGSGKPAQHDLVNIVLSFLLVPNPQEPVLGVAWTLIYEISFYVLFLAVIGFGRRALLLLPLWATAIVIAHMVARTSFSTAFFLNPFNIDFIGGVGAAVLLRGEHRQMPAGTMLVGIVAFLGSMVFWSTSQADPLVGRLVYGGASVLFVLGCVEFESRRAFVPPRFAMMIGASSYALYLTHPTMISAGAQLLCRFARAVHNAEIGVALVALMAVAGGILYHLIVEKRLVAFARWAICALRR